MPTKNFNFLYISIAIYIVLAFVSLRVNSLSRLQAQIYKYQRETGLTVTGSISEEELTESSSSLSSSLGDINGDLPDFQGPWQDFQDGTVRCSDFPSGQGVIPLDWLNFGGWASIMNQNGETRTTCENGFFCSYACQAGMSKTQWPDEQPANGISVGGLLCQNGYLYKSNHAKSKLCEWGENSSYAVNKLSQGIALCRTDYPGSENMAVPTWLEPGQSKPMSVVKEDDYYHWRGGKTSSQYYVNNAGVSVKDGCIWGNEGSGIGNWAPVVFGAGYTDNISWLSLIPNPNNRTPPNFNVKIEATSGSNMNGECKYENGVFSGGVYGCTVAVTSGSANFVFY